MREKSLEMYLEHANITVEDIDEAIKFLQIAFPHFKIRGRDQSEVDGVTRKWLHIGTEMTYVALEEVSSETEVIRRPYRDVGINHIGFVVDDVDIIARNLETAGYKKSIDVEPHPYRKRVYYYDGTGIEYEFIQYLSDEPEKRNDYEF